MKEQNEEKFIPSAEPPLTDYIITIGRAYGSGGRSVGKPLAEKLNIPYYDAALLEETAKHSGLNQKYLASMDEKSVGANGLRGNYHSRCILRWLAKGMGCVEHGKGDLDRWRSSSL
ncbi:MAG: cytidylate kinase-like family protein [Lachnospiraceae bacterium]|nr:cytidylate kinase-like family protein [Lachnospiraceae bacterium]